jgi:heptosyltransferase I
MNSHDAKGLPGQESFLIVRLSSLGDLVHTIPVVPALRESFPRARIDWLVDSRWRPLVELVDGVDEVIPFSRSSGNAIRCVRRLRQAKYTCALDLQGRHRSALLSWLSGAPRRIGRHGQATRDPGAAWLYTERVIPAGKHIADMHVSLAVHAGARQPATLRFPLRVPNGEASMRLHNWLLHQGVRDYVVISPGGGWVSKRWPPDRFGALAAELWRQESLRAIVNIAGGEEHLAREIVRAAGAAKPLVISPSLPELAVLLAEARLVVVGDTGPLHLASALGTPVVALFGDTDPARNGPLPRGRVVQNFSTPPPAYLRGNYVRGSSYSVAMLSLTADQVLAAVQQELVATV